MKRSQYYVYIIADGKCNSPVLLTTAFGGTGTGKWSAVLYSSLPDSKFIPSV
jgi:hypothetical protein